MNKENLTLEHLAKHLPFGLKVLYTHTKNIGQISNIYTIGEGHDNDDIKLSIGYDQSEHIWMFKPILRPLSDLKKEIEHNGERFIPIVRLASTLGFAYGGELHSIGLGLLSDKIRIESLPYEIIMKFIEWHFDVDNLIEKGLAIDINTLETNPYD